MDPKIKYNVYALLSAVILVDRKVLDVEVDSFVRLILGFQTALNEPNPDTSTDVKSWFRANELEISSWVNSDQRNENLLRILKNIETCDCKWQILQAMRSVAISDSEFHISEMELVKFVNDHWDEKDKIILDERLFNTR